MHCVLAGVGAETGAYNGFVKFKMYRMFFAEEVDFLQKCVIMCYNLTGVVYQPPLLVINAVFSFRRRGMRLLRTP